ncbi:DUF3857 domain-containing protein [candidate division KSB1 bacterium]|nr:DUF3857 domain-containing protein [candidate division KSB1 bacterium]
MFSKIRLSSSLAFFVLVLVAAVWADYSNLPEAAKTPLTRVSAYPQSSSVLLYEDQRHWMGSTGIQAEQFYQLRYIADSSVARKYATFRVPYVAGRDSLEFRTATVFRPTGETDDADVFEGIRDLPVDALQDAPDFAEFRELRVQLPELRPGSIVELGYRIITKEPLIPWESGELVLRGTEPVILRSYLAKVPIGDTTNYVLLSDASEPRIDTNYATWIVGEMPPIPVDSLTRFPHRTPRMEWSSLDDWTILRDTLISWIDAVSADSLELPPSLIRDKRAARAGVGMVDLVRGWVSHHVRPVVYTGHRDFNLTLRRPSRVIETGYGNALEAAVLVRALAAKLGSPCDVVLHFEREPLVPRLETLSTQLVHSYSLIADSLDGLPRYQNPWPVETVLPVKLSDAWLFPLRANVSAPFAYSDR